MLCEDGRYVKNFAKQVPRLRQRWGYKSFRELLGVDDEGSDLESEEEEDHAECWYRKNCDCCGYGGVSNDEDKYWPLQFERSSPKKHP
jgi:hypothetical protein